MGEVVAIEDMILRQHSPPFISNLDVMLMAEHSIPEEDKKQFVDEFLSASNMYSPLRKPFTDWCSESKENFTEFVKNVELSWNTYLSLIYYMDAFTDSIDVMYPSKTWLIKRLVDTTYSLNQHIYFMTGMEKDVYESMLQHLDESRMADLITSIKSFPVYLAEKFKDVKDNQKNQFYLRNLIAKDKDALELFYSCSCSLQMFGEVLENVGNLEKTALQKKFVPNDEFEKSLEMIIRYDHVLELFLRKSKVLNLDMIFYMKLCEKLGAKRQFSALSQKLQDIQERQTESFKFGIQKYYQTSLSCGVACFMNCLSIFKKDAPLDKKLERLLESKVTVPGFYNNIPSTLARLARTEYGIPATFLADMKTFAPIYLNNWENQLFPPVRKFLEDYKLVPHEDIRGLTPEDTTRRLQDGSMIAYVFGTGEMLHYCLIYGYKKTSDGTAFNVFDPMNGSFQMLSDELYSATRNSKSFWAVEYRAPDSVILEPVEDKIKIAERCISWLKNIASTRMK